MKYEMSYVENGKPIIFQATEYSQLVTEIIKHDLHVADVELKEASDDNNTFDVKQCRL